MISSATDLTPVLETPRLRLRAQVAADLDPACRLWSDPAVYRFIGGQPRSREDVWRRILANAGSWSLLGFGSWAVEDREGGGYLGVAGLLDAQRALHPPSASGAIEAGWAISPAAHGRGLAQEAMGAVLEWADRMIPQRHLVCMIAPENAPSIRLAERLGFREYARTTYGGEATVLFERAMRDV